MIPTRLNQTISNGAVCGIVFSSDGPCSLLLNKKYVGVFEECSVVNQTVTPKQIPWSFGNYPTEEWQLPSKSEIKIVSRNLQVLDTRRMFALFSGLHFNATRNFQGRACQQFYIPGGTIGDYHSVFAIAMFVKRVPILEVLN